MSNILGLFNDSFGDEEGAAASSSSLYDLDPRSLVTAKAKEYGVPVNLALAMTNQESGFDNSAVSPKKARGLMQLMPGTAKDLGVDPTDPVQNVDGGMRYLRQNFDKFGDWNLALAAYHAGPGAVSNAGGIPNTNDGLIETKNYVKSIMGQANRLGGLYLDGEAAPDATARMADKMVAPRDRGMKSTGSDVLDLFLGGGTYNTDAAIQSDEATATTGPMPVSKAERSMGIIGAAREFTENDKGRYVNLPKQFSAGLADVIGGTAAWINGFREEHGAAKDEILSKVQEWGTRNADELNRELMKDPDILQAAQELGKAKGFWETMGAVMQNPEIAEDVLVRSMGAFLPGIPLAGVGGMVGGAAGATTAAARIAALAGVSASRAAQLGRVAGATLAGASAEGVLTGGSAYLDIEKKMIEGGLSPEEARREAVAGATEIGVITGVLSLFGSGSAVAHLVTGGLGKAGLKEAVKDAGKSMFKTGVEEGVQEYAEGAITDKRLRDQNLPSDFDPGKQFALGAIAGTAMGGAMEAPAVAKEAMQPSIPTLTQQYAPEAPAGAPVAPAAPSQSIKPVDLQGTMDAIAGAPSVDVAIANMLDMVGKTEVKSAGIDLDSLSRVQQITSVADTDALRGMMDQLSPEARQSFLAALDTVRSGDPRVPNAARVAATEQVYGQLESSGTLQAAQQEMNQKALAGTPQERAAIEQASQFLSSGFGQLAANQPDNVRQAMETTAQQVRDSSLPDAVRAEAAARLNDFAKASGVGQETKTTPAKTKAEEVDETPKQLASNLQALQTITSSPEWKAHVASLKGQERADVLDQLGTVTNAKLAASYRNGAAAALLARAEDAGIGIPSTGPAPATGAAPTGRVRVADAQAVLARATFAPEDGTIRLADPRTPRAGAVSSGEANIVQALGRAFGKQVVFFEQDGNTAHRDGFVLEEAPNMVFLNRMQSGSASIYAVAGHEIAHKMPREILQKFIEAVQPTLKAGSLEAYREYANAQGLNDDATMEEIAADLFGNGFNKPELMKAALADMPVSAATKLVNAVRDVIRKMIAALKGMKDFDTSALVSDMQAVDAAWKSAFREYLAAENAGQGMINGRAAESLSMEELAELMEQKDSPVAEKAESEIARRSTYPDYDAIDSLAKKTGKKDWKGWPIVPEKEAKSVVTMKDRLQAQLDARKKRDRGELLTAAELEAANAPDVQKKPDAKIEVVENQKKIEREVKDPNAIDEQTAEELQAELEAELLEEDYNEEMPIRYSTVRDNIADPEGRKEVSTAKPTGKKAAEAGNDSVSQLRVIDKADIAASKTHLAAIGRALASYNTLSGKGDANALMKELHDTVVDNLLWLHDKLPEKIRERAKLWYDGANNIANDWTKKYNVSERQAAGVLAVLSPQMDWFKNVSLAERTLSIWQTRQDQVWTPAMTRWAESWAEAADEDTLASRTETVADARRLEGTPLFEMNDRDAARFVRVFDETYHERSYRVVTPEGGFGDLATNSDDGDAKVTWGGFDSIEKAVSVLRDGSFRNVDAQLGGNHKVRNFFNNIIAPNSEFGHVTIDTHAIGAALMKTVSGSSPEVADNFGKAGRTELTGARGTYALFADAYREAAAKRGVLAREMQSITWEAVRALFPAGQKRVITPVVNAVWDRFRAGEISRAEARKQVEQIGGGIREMAWEQSGLGVRAADGATSFTVPTSINPEQGNTLPVERSVSLSSSTSSIPGLDTLTRLALEGNTAAHSLLQDVAVDSLRRLLDGTDAKVRYDRATGLFEGMAEPSIGISLTFRDAEQGRVLAALAKFAENFNQKQVHVRRGTVDPVGTVYDDGSYATLVYRWTLPQALSRKQVQNVIDKSGLYGLTFGDGFVEAYYVGNPEDQSAIEEFVGGIEKANAQLSRSGGTLEQAVERLWPYGDGAGAIGYERIAGNLPAGGEAVHVETARRIASFLNDGAKVRAFDQADTITAAQDALQTEIARAYAAVPVNDLKNPVVRKAYRELKKETIRQFNTLPVKVEVFTGEGEPYANSDAMRRDILDNNHLYIYATTPETFGPVGQDFSKHPLLEQTGITDINGYPMVANDLFRAIHDYFAHGMSRTQFGPKGEESAWKNHMASTNNPWARWALTMETRGQNSWVNFRPDLDRSTPVKERPFAEQKAALLPVEYALTGDIRTDRMMKDFIKTLPKSQQAGSMRGELDFGGKYSSARSQIPATWQMDGDSKMDSFIHTMQDKNVDMKRAVEAVKAAGRNIVDKFDPYLQEELYHGRTAKATKDFLDHEMKPLLQSMQATGVEIAELNEFLHMRHAGERNAQVARINPAMPDGGSGVTNAEIARYMGQLDPQRSRTLNALARRVDAITKATRDLMVSSGLETRQTINEWEQTYRHYVPLMREDIGIERLGSGAGFSVKGSSSKRAMGSDKPVADILAHIALMRERTITRAEKSRVGVALMGMAIQNPNPDFWLPVIPGRDVAKQQAALSAMGVDPMLASNLLNQPSKRFIDPRTGLVREMVDNNLGSEPNVIAVRSFGKDYYLVMNEQNERAMRMASTLKNLDPQQLGLVLSNVAKVTRWFAAVNTQYNPIFGILNVTRDLGGSMLNLTTTEIAGQQAAVAANVAPAMRGIYLSLRKERSGQAHRSQWADLWEEFQDAGGRTGYRDMFASSGERAQAIQKELEALSDGKAKMLGKGIMGWLGDFNDTLENSVRLSAYKVAKEQGLSNERAASLAKNLTVNFNRKGTIATQAGALYAFFNASTQGTARLWETMKGPAGAKIVMGGLVLGAVQAAALAAAGMDDEIPEFVKQRNVIIPTGGGKYVTIPMPLGFNVIPSFSRLVTEWANRGFKQPGKTVEAMLDMMADNFNPIGNAGLSVQTIAPTFADPLVALAENRDWTGKPIAKPMRSSLDPTPGHDRAYATASDFGKGISRAVNWITGGNEYRKGALSPTPDQIDYLIGQVTGGVGREALKVNETIQAARTGEELPPSKVPLLGRFIGNVNAQSVSSTKFYENVTRINMAESELKGMKEDKLPTSEFVLAHPELRLAKEADQAQKEVGSLRKMKQKLIDSDADKSRVNAIDQRITSVMDRLNKKLEGLEERQ